MRYHEGMPEEVFETECPCCGTVLEIDAANQVILSHQEPAPQSSPQDLQEAVRHLRSVEQARDEQFQKQVDAKRRHEEEASKRFDGLLKKARIEGPVKPALRDIDLD